MSLQYTHNSTQSALVAVSNRVRRQLLSKQTNNMIHSDEPEDFLDGKFVFQKNKDGIFNEPKVICTLAVVIVSPLQYQPKVPPQRDACVGRRGEFKWNAPNHPHLTM